ncbi:hypothetical protein WUBG_09854 [Wuchereria bancrofti]|uniref:Uncharacterized protein n=1 Tax=Wuchereria bancrofti TaxID=6293 RepID=J9EVJ4_WUCBA|nr:hypothetical protein WUBG_09854 [Wuchereria bancrofti]VDM12454.1 unnamed protein product [Wuchereria bancrofti]
MSQQQSIEQTSKLRLVQCIKKNQGGFRSSVGSVIKVESYPEMDENSKEETDKLCLTMYQSAFRVITFGLCSAAVSFEWIKHLRQHATILKHFFVHPVSPTQCVMHF